MLTKGNVGTASVQTLNTFATIDTTLSNGTYYWRARAIDRSDDAGRWSSRGPLLEEVLDDKASAGRPRFRHFHAVLAVPLVLRWTQVPHAYKYLVEIGTDPSLGSLVGGGPIETSGNVLTPRIPLTAGRYYWAVTPLDSDLHKGARSAVSSFDWNGQPIRAPTSPTSMVILGSTTRSSPGLPSPAPPATRSRSTPPRTSRPARKFAAPTRRSARLSPTRVLPNNHYYWRVRALDLAGNAGQWNVGTSFDKSFDNVNPTVPALQLRDNEGNVLAAGATTSSP